MSSGGGADTAVDALRKRHAQHRADTEDRRMKVYGKEAVEAQAEK